MVSLLMGKPCGAYANTHLQLLSHHSFAVGFLTYTLFNQVVDSNQHRNLSQVAFLAGCLHDVGKLDPEFQNWVKKGKQKDDDDGQHIDAGKFSSDKHPRHNELSLFLCQLFEDNNKKLNRALKNALKHSIYWHHARPYRKDNAFETLTDIYGYFKKNIGEEAVIVFIEQAIKLLGQINRLAKDYDDKLPTIDEYLSWQVDNLPEQIAQTLDKNQLPVFKHYDAFDDFDTLQDKIGQNAYYDVLRACLVSADRLISALSAQDLADYIAQNRLEEMLQPLLCDGSVNLKYHIQNGLDTFANSERTQKQQHIAHALSQIDDVAVLSGAAGCGKTKIALEWASHQHAQKILWICPRVQVCLSVFQELSQVYLPDGSVEIFTGEYKYTGSLAKPTAASEYFCADVVVTTIDQLLNTIISHTKVNGLISFLNAHVVFDEFHEYIVMEGFNLLFAELVATKKMRQPNTIRALLVSATPNYLYLNKVLDISKHHIQDMPSFNPSQYRLEFKTYQDDNKDNNPFYQSYQQKRTFVISNTATLAQLGFIYQKDTENSILWHSKYKRSDQKYLFNEVFESFCQNGNNCYQVLRSGPIVQASLNISCDFMVTQMSNPENILQRIGRLDRFGKNQSTNVVQIAITDGVKHGKCVGATACFLNQRHSLQSAKIWYDYLCEHLLDTVFDLPKLYQVYKAFYYDSHTQSYLSDDLQNALKSSIHAITQKVAEPTRIVKTKTADKKRKISKHSLRGDSRFVQLAVMNVDDYQNPIFANQYAYAPPIKDGDDYDNLTEGLSHIKDMGILDYLAKKHGRIDPTHPIKPVPDKKHGTKMLMLENYARNADFPLYLSYTPEHLDLIKEKANPNAVYYAMCKKQAIGSLSHQYLLTLTQTIHTTETE